MVGGCEGCGGGVGCRWRIVVKVVVVVLGVGNSIGGGG